jgi:pimeloyl-ACP methyl ester carboxylesterase
MKLGLLNRVFIDSFLNISNNIKAFKTTHNILSTGGDNSPLSINITTKSYHSKMKNVTIPALFLVGKYDFICPPALHKAAFDSTACYRSNAVYD